MRIERSFRLIIRVSFSNETTCYLYKPYWHFIRDFFFLQSRKTLKTRIINILKKFDTHMVYMLNSNQGRKWQKYVKIKTIRAGIDMGVSPRLRHKFSCINAWSSYFESDARSLSAPWAIYSIFIVNSLQTQAFFTWRKTTTGKTSSPHSQPIMSTALNVPFGLTFWATVSWGGPMKGPKSLDMGARNSG